MGMSSSKNVSCSEMVVKKESSSVLTEGESLLLICIKKFFVNWSVFEICVIKYSNRKNFLLVCMGLYSNLGQYNYYY